jgi:iron complex outermembrane receptor protein
MKLSIISAFLFVLIPSLVMAESPSQTLSELDFDELMQLKITSVSKKSEKLSEAAAAVYVVTEDEIRRSGATNIPEALRLVPGVDVAQIDPNKWAVSIRGFNGRFANKLLVLIDGRSVYTPSFSGVYWEYFDYLMKDIARIEVIRGPGATLWGANAVNGIINIITREAGENPGGALSVSAGEEYKGVSIRQGGELSDNMQLRAYAKGKRLDESVNLVGEGQDNGGDYLQTGFRLDIQPNDEQSLTFQGDLYRDDLNQEHILPTYQAPYTEIYNGDIDAKGGNVGVSWGVLTGLDSEVTARFNYDFYDHQEIKYSEDRQTFNVELQHQFSPFNNHEFIWGGGYRLSENNFTSTEYVVTSNVSGDSEIWNLFFQDNISFPEQNITLTLGAKLENNNYTGTEIQPNIRVAWVPTAKVTWWAAISRANRTPSRADNELVVFSGAIYDPTIGAVVASKGYGSSDFKSEQLDAYEFGSRWKLTPQISLDFAAFYNDYDNLRSTLIGSIDYSNYPDYLSVPLYLNNTIQGHSKGFELLMNWQASSAARFRFVYNYLDIQLNDEQENSSSSQIISLDEDRSLSHQVSLWGAFDLSPTLEIDARLYYNAERSWRTEKIDAIVDADLRLGWRANESLDLSLVGRNLLHSEEQAFIAEAWGSASAIERNIFLNATYKW